VRACVRARLGSFRTIASWRAALPLTHSRIDTLGDTAIPTYEQLNQLNYMSAFIKEVLRLHSPAPAFVRQPIDNFELGGFTIPARTPIIINSWTVHRDPTLWPNPEEFSPSRYDDSIDCFRSVGVYATFAHILESHCGNKQLLSREHQRSSSNGMDAICCRCAKLHRYAVCTARSAHDIVAAAAKVCFELGLDSYDRDCIIIIISSRR